ncbi:MAG: hypothetical protein LKI94_02625 [Sporolactobacillus sp.]|nr:hypothetical protein [Sporolactobacillus sp.]
MELLQDFRAVHGRRWQVLLANRGFHALIIYRLSHFLWKRHVPILPMIFSRLIHHRRH